MKCLTLLLALASAATAQSSGIIGDWQGVLIDSGNQIHLTLHVRQNDRGKLGATMDSAEQGAHGVPVTSLAYTGSNLAFVIDTVHATYSGALNSTTGAFDGVWSQGVPTPLTFIRLVESPTPPQPSPLDGVWQGILQVGGYQLHVTFHIETDRTGLKATMDSPDQKQFGIPVTDSRLEGNILILQLPNIGARYQGTVASNLATIDGEYTQGGAGVPLTLTRAKKDGVQEGPAAQ